MGVLVGGWGWAEWVGMEFSGRMGCFGNIVASAIQRDGCRRN